MPSVGPVDCPPGNVGIVAAQAIHAETDEATHLPLVVDGPGEHAVLRRVDRVHEGGVDHLVLLPQHRGTRILERLEGPDRIGGEQHPPRQGGPRPSQPAHDPVIEAVHGAAPLVDALIEHGE